MPLKIALVCMPFGSLTLPSIGLTQLKAVTETAADRAVSLHYLNHDFGRLFGPDLYDFFEASGPSLATGIADWIFRRAAFPDAADNTDAYFERYAFHFRGTPLDDMSLLLEQRSRLEPFLDELIVRYRLHEADLVGMTSMFSQNLPSIALAQRLRRMNPDQILVMGGANCEGTMGVELITNVPVIDYVFSGTSLISFPKFIECVLSGDEAGRHRIDGVFSRRNCRSVATMVSDASEVDWSSFKAETLLDGVRSLGQELSINNTPIELDYDDYLDSLGRIVPALRGSAHINFETSRGCWWGERAHCTFCGLNGGTMAYRSMRPDLAMQLLQRLFDRYADRVNMFDSVDNIMPKEYVDGVFGKIKPPDNVNMFYEVKADLTEEQVRTLAHGHVMRIQPGIEALATSTLKLMRKGTTAFHSIRLLTYCKRYGVTPYWNLLVGFPGETAEVYEMYAKLLPSLFHLPPPSVVTTVRFDRYSPYFTFARDYGLKLAPYDFYELCYPFPAASLHNMAYYFRDLNHDAQYIDDVSVWIKELGGLTAKWKQSWERANGPPQLEMRTEKEVAMIDDTRGRIANHYRLSTPEAELLRSIGQPVREEELTESYGVSVDKVRNRGLVFSERGKIISLVLEN